MVIGIEAERANAPQKTGVEHYAKQLILHLAKMDTANTYILYLRTKPGDWFLGLPKNFKVKVIPFPIFWTQIRLSWEMLLYPVEVLFIPASSMPLMHPKKTVVTVHDVAFMFFPESYTWFARSLHKLEDLLAKFFAWKVIAVSESTKRDFVKMWHANPNKVKVVYHGFESLAAQIPLSETVSRRVPEKFILFLSTLQPRKNLGRLIDSFLLLKKQLPDLPHKLVVVGRPGWKFGSMLKKIDENKDVVVYLNYVSDSDRLEIMKKSDLMVLPSLYEGFGMGILEAFAAGVPVAVSNVSSMPEVAEEAAVYFNPLDVNDMTRAIKSVLLDKSFSDRLKDAGAKRLLHFSWDRCAKETLDILTRT